MKPFYLLLLLLPLVWSCGSDDDMSDDDMRCPDNIPATILNCPLSDGVWSIKSVNSNIARPHLSGSTTNWLTFHLPCYSSTVLDWNGFLPTSNMTHAAFFPIDASSDNCVSDIANTIVADDDFLRADLSYSEGYSLFMYGLPFEDQFADDETWYDIEFKREEYLRFKVDKLIDGVRYEVSVEMDPVL